MKNKLRILVIDDEVALGELYLNFLERIGANVTFCDHPQKGWLAIDKDEYDLIITDLKMPIITGDEFISIVRASKLNAHTPIILCSAFINKLVITELSRESKVYFLSKPFDSKTLLDLVTKSLGVRSSESRENEELDHLWLQDFIDTLKSAISGPVEKSEIEQFESWNYESISLNIVVMKDEGFINATFLMKLKTFLKIAGKIQGTQYKELEPETLHVWKDLLSKAAREEGRVTFSKILSQEIITLPEQKSTFYKLNASYGEILVYLN